MTYFNKETKEIYFKVLYVGARSSGKTQNLRSLYKEIASGFKKDQVAYKAPLEESEYFEFMPVGVGKFEDTLLRLHLYTMPTYGVYDVFPQMLFKGVDAIVYVVDSRDTQLIENKEAIDNVENLAEDLGIDIDRLVHLFQYNKMDLEDTIDVKVLDKHLNPKKYQSINTSVIKDGYAMDTLLCLTNNLISRLS